MTDEILQTLNDAAKINMWMSIMKTGFILALGCSLLLFIVLKLYKNKLIEKKEIYLMLFLYFIGVVLVTLSCFSLYEKYILFKNDAYVYKYILGKDADLNK